MSERAQEETKWRLGELAHVRVHHGHASAVRLRRQQENGARPTRTTSIFVVCRRSTGTGARHALTISFSVRTSFFFVVITVSVDGKTLDLLCQWTLKKRLAGATSEPIPSCPSCACDWEHLDRRCCTSRILSCDGVHAFSCSHLCHLSLPLFLDSLISNGGFMLQRGERHFLKLSVSLSLSLLHHRVLWQEINQVRGYGFGEQVFFFLNFAKQWW